MARRRTCDRCGHRFADAAVTVYLVKYRCGHEWLLTLCLACDDETAEVEVDDLAVIYGANEP